jgi:hypothetical protein
MNIAFDLVQANSVAARKCELVIHEAKIVTDYLMIRLCERQCAPFHVPDNPNGHANMVRHYLRTLTPLACKARTASATRPALIFMARAITNVLTVSCPSARSA